MQQSAGQLTACETLDDVAYLLEIPIYKLQLLSTLGEYHCFNLPKSDGSLRYIEAPSGTHKMVLKRLNYYLQCVYYFLRPRAAFGFMLGAQEEAQPRNIVTHAQKHLSAPYMLNVDFEDFFHQISEERVCNLFLTHTFKLRASAAATLASLCCFKARLPMGSPTSPVLSNFAALTLDASLEEFANTQQLTYTRFADDLTFSSKTPLPNELLEQVTQHCAEYSYKINPEKTSWYGKNDLKIVTGLVVTEQVRLPEHFFSELADNLKRLQHLNEAKLMVKGDRSSTLLKTFKQQVEGKLNFVELVYGSASENYREYQQRFIKSCAPKLSTRTLKWMELPYSI